MKTYTTAIILFLLSTATAYAGGSYSDDVIVDNNAEAGASAISTGASSSVGGNTYLMGNMGASYNPVAYVDSINGINCVQDSISLSGQQNYDAGGNNAGSGVYATYTHTFGGEDCKTARGLQIKSMRAAALYQVKLDAHNVAIMTEQLKAATLQNETMRINTCKSFHHNTTVGESDYFVKLCKGVEFLHPPSPSHDSVHARIAPHVTVK